YQPVTISFVDANGSQLFSSAEANGNGEFAILACIPTNASPGADTIVAQSPRGLAIGWTTYRVLAPRATLSGHGSATGNRGTAKTPSVASGGKSTARVPGRTSGEKGTARA